MVIALKILTAASEQPELQPACNDGICSWLGIVTVPTQSEINLINSFPLR